MRAHPLSISKTKNRTINYMQCVVLYISKNYRGSQKSFPASNRNNSGNIGPKSLVNYIFKKNYKKNLKSKDHYGILKCVVT